MLRRLKAEGDPAPEFSPCFRQTRVIFNVYGKSALIIRAAFENSRLMVTHPDSWTQFIDPHPEHCMQELTNFESCPGFYSTLC